MPTPDQIRQQSLSAYGQWCVQWREHAKIHSSYPMKPLSDFENIGIGKACLLIANGYSFEENIETIKAHKDNVDIMVCDKTLGHALENGIKPTYCVVCDANVSYEKYLEPYKDQVQDTILFINVCGNPKWTKNGNWKDIYFFVNMDILHSEKEFSELSGCKNTIPASTNVSNSMVVFLTQSDNNGRKNFFGYDKILVIGFDYSWRPGKKYYSFDTDGGGKANYMRHIHCATLNNNLAYTSNNLHFSAQWLEKYVKTFNLPVIQCSQETILGLSVRSTLDKQMSYKHKPEDADVVREGTRRRRELMKEVSRIETRLQAISKDHLMAVNASI